MVSTRSRTVCSKPGFIKSRSMLPLWVAQRHRLGFPTRPPLLPEMETTPNSRFRHHALDIETGELLRFRRVLIRASPQRCLSASVPSEFLLSLDLLPALPCLVVPSLLPPNLLPLRMPPLVLYTDNFLPVPVSVTSFTGAVLLKCTRLQTTGLYLYGTWNTRRAFRSWILLLIHHLRTPTRLPARNHFS
jgi:hypothetical protein